MRPLLVTPPDGKVLSVEAVSENLRIGHNDDDDLIAGLIVAVTSYLDGPSGVLRNCLIDQVWAIRGERWADMRIGLGNADSIERVSYWPADGSAEVVMDASAYRIGIDMNGSRLILRDGARPALAERADAATVHFKAGYGPKGTEVPNAVRQAMHLLVGHYYKHSEAVITGTRPTELPMGVWSLLAPFRLQGV